MYNGRVKVDNEWYFYKKKHDDAHQLSETHLEHVLGGLTTFLRYDDVIVRIISPEEPMTALDELTKLTELKDKKALTDKEFDGLKSEIFKRLENILARRNKA
jgi:hypothetical protein